MSYVIQSSLVIFLSAAMNFAFFAALFWGIFYLGGISREFKLAAQIALYATLLKEGIWALLGAYEFSRGVVMFESTTAFRVGTGIAIGVAFLPLLNSGISTVRVLLATLAAVALGIFGRHFIFLWLASLA